MLENHPSLLAPLVKFLQQTDRLEMAVDLTEEFQSRFETRPEWQLAAAEVWFHLKEFQRGDLALMEALRLDPYSVETLEFSAFIHRVRSNSFMELESLQTLLPLLKDERQRNRTLSRMVVPLFDFERYDDIIALYEENEFSDKGWGNLYRYAVALQRCGYAARADEAFEAAAKRAGITLNESAERLLLLHYRFSDYESASNQMASLGEKSVSSETLRAAATAAAITDDFQLALERYQKLTQTDNNRPEDFYNFGATAELAGDFLQAREAYKSGFRKATGKLQQEMLFRQFLSEIQLGNTAEAMSLIPLFSGLVRKKKDAYLKDISDQELYLLYLAGGDEVDLKAVAFEQGRRQMEAGNLSGAVVSFRDLWERQVPFIDPQGWQKQFSLTKNEYYLEQLNAPIINDVVLVEAFLGRRISCNPLALVLQALQETQYDHLAFIFSITEETKIPRALQDHPRVSFVLRSSYEYRRLVARAEYLINNVTFPDYFVRREEQQYLNTWHGIPWKTLGRDIQGGDFSYGNVAKNMIVATHLAFPDRHTAEVLTDRQGISALLNGKVGLTGSPRVDLTLTMSEQQKQYIKGVLGSEKNSLTVLYAPTWREWAAQELDPAATFRETVQTLSTEFPEITLAVRAHHFLESAIDDLNDLPNVVVVPEEIDTNDLLAVVDVLVSDYSSIIFDFATTGRPILKLTNDIARYQEERGLYFEPEAIPGETSTNLQELQKSLRQVINTFGEQRSYETAFSEYEDGKAGARTLSFFFNGVLESQRSFQAKGLESSRPKILLSVSGLNPNGITRSLQSLVTNLSARGIDPYLLIYPEVLKNPAVQNTVLDLKRHSELIPAYNHVFSSRSERAMGRYYYSGLGRKQLSEGSLLSKQMQREFRRQFGDAAFDAVVEFDGYNPTRTLFCAFGSKNAQRVHVFHNDFYKEATSRFPRLRSSMMTMNSFDVIGSVSATVKEENVAYLSRFGSTSEHHIVIRNTLDLGFLEEMSQLPLDEDVQDWYDRDTSSRVAVIVGRISPEKNHETLIRAFAKAKSEGDLNLRVLVLGEGPLRLKHEQLVQSLSLENEIWFAGHRANPYPAVVRADAMYLPSLYEGQPIVLLEALVLGVPVVATDIPGSRAVLSEGNGGTLVSTSPEGVLEGLLAIASGSLEPVQFEAKKYNEQVTSEFIDITLHK